MWVFAGKLFQKFSHEKPRSAGGLAAARSRSRSDYGSRRFATPGGRAWHEVAKVFSRKTYLNSPLWGQKRQEKNFFAKKLKKFWLEG
ncbi:MAG: hypothetical protein IJW92_08045 [Clostridia bacterium]|nr:hypothetical protein [Clostridia bacterium]